MDTNTHLKFSRPSWKTIGIVTTSMAFAFLIGVNTAGDVHPIIGSTNADNSLVEGDLNGNGRIDIDDALEALDIARGYRTATPDELSADPNGDYVITLGDVATILTDIRNTSGTPGR
jgi:hypothetical protein